MKKFYLSAIAALMSVASMSAVEGAELYLRGSFNNWTTDNPFTETIPGVYTLKVDQLSGKFKVADAEWATANWGGREGEVLTVGNPFTMETGVNPPDISLGDVLVKQAVVTLDTNPEAWTLLVEGTPSVIATFNVAVAGAFNSWSSEANKVTIDTAVDGDVATFVIPNWSNEGDGSGFKIVVNGSWLTNMKIQTLGVWTPCALDRQQNMRLPEACEGKTVTINYNVSTGELMVECDCNPVYTLSLVGIDNDWSTSARAAQANAEGNVVWVVAAYDAPWGFKIVNGEAWMGLNKTIKLGITYDLCGEWTGSGDGNTYLPSGCNGQEVTFTYNIFKETLTVTCPTAGETVPRVALAGAFNSWSNSAYVVEAVENVATFAVNEFTNAVEGQGEGVKFVYENTWYGAPAQFVFGEWTIELYDSGDGANLTLPEEADGQTVTFYFNVVTLKAKAYWMSTGVTSVAADAAEAVYYNLQGVQVANPTHGLYIRVQGNNVTKVVK